MVADGSADARSRQHRVLIAYTAFWLLRSRLGCAAADGLGGKLVVAAAFEQTESELALGATLAGAAFLGVEPDPDAIKRAMRAECCDFMVNNLDEALRILKNELRKRKPVSIGLLGQPADVFREILERGVLPDVLASAGIPDASEDVAGRQVDAAFQTLRETGSIGIDFAGGHRSEAGVVEAEEIVGAWSDANGMSAAVTDGNAERLKAADLLALNELPGDDRMRRRWLELAPKYFRRDLPLARVMWISDAERARQAAPPDRIG